MKDFNMNKFKGLLKSKNMRLEPQDTFNSIDEPITWICHRCPGLPRRPRGGAQGG